MKDLLLVAAEPLMRSAVCSALGERFGEPLIADTMRRAQYVLDQLLPSAAILVLDPPLTDASLEEACVALVAQHLGTPSLVLLRHPQPCLIRMVGSYGARGIFDTLIEPCRLRTALIRITDGGYAFDTSFAPYLATDDFLLPNGRTSRRLLTNSQNQSLRLLAEGYSSKEIAKLLHSSPDAVDHAIERATRRLGAAHRTQAVAIALRAGLIP